ncbi:MAG: Nif3-like dinuclear metal center hexameric protein [Pseudomonadota bacterium]
MVNIKDILEILNQIARFDIAEKWDNSGLQAGSMNWEVKKIIIGLDVSMPLMQAAKKSNCDLVLTHHPLMITPEKSFDFQKMPGSAIQIAARDKISIISVHTNLDKANDGLNDYFASKIGVQTIKSFLPLFPGDEPEGQVSGMGRLGCLQTPMTVQELAEQIKNKLGLLNLRVTGDLDRKVKTIAICTGSGGSLVDEFIKSETDVFITGDVKYHEARLVEQASKVLIDVGHFGSEHMVIDLLSSRLRLAFKNVGLNIEVNKFLKEKDPFTIV